MISEQRRANTLDFLSHRFPLAPRSQEAKSRTLQNTEREEELEIY